MAVVLAAGNANRWAAMVLQNYPQRREDYHRQRNQQTVKASVISQTLIYTCGAYQIVFCHVHMLVVDLNRISCGWWIWNRC
jgi:hypothetical protein